MPCLMAAWCSVSACRVSASWEQVNVCFKKTSVESGGPPGVPARKPETHVFLGERPAEELESLGSAVDQRLLAVSPSEALLVQSFRHFDYFQGSIHFPRGRLADPSNRTMQVSGWVSGTHGIFRNCWGCYAGVCTSRKLCCRRKPSAACFDGLYFLKEVCCDMRQTAYENHPEILTEALYQQLGIEQKYQRFTARCCAAVQKSFLMQRI